MGTVEAALTSGQQAAMQIIQKIL